jgi:hypothetical protein
MMCSATSWVIDTDAKRASAIYRRYLHQGARVKWGADFARDCPPPDFDSARWLPLKQVWWRTRHFARHYWLALLLALGSVVTGVIGLRRRRAAH